MKTWLLKLFSSDVSVSSKRVFGAIGFIAMLIKVAVMKDTSLVTEMIIVSASLLGLETIANALRKTSDPASDQSPS